MGWFLLAVVAVVGALTLDHLGVAGGSPRPVTLGRAVGGFLVLLGVALLLAS